MQATFLLSLKNFEITDPLGVGDRISDDLRVTNDRHEIGSLIPAWARSSIGEMEYESLLSGAPVVFSRQSVRDDMPAQKYLLSRLHHVQTFLMATWVFLDNAINYEQGFLFHGTTVESNFLSVIYSTAGGEKPVTRMSREELRKIRSIYRSKFTPLETDGELPPTQLTRQVDRASRATLFLNIARSSRDIAMKVAHYCSAFETLFATAQTELAHQLAERVACFLQVEGEAKLKAYRQIKAAYALRSKVVHGAALSGRSVEDIQRISEECDSIARQVFFRILHNPSDADLFRKKADEFEEAMLARILVTQSQ